MAAIAQQPLAQRDQSRLLDATEPTLVHRQVRDLLAVLNPGDVVVRNTTRVRHARLLFTRHGGGAGEVLLLRPRGDGWWEALARPSRKLLPGDRFPIDGTLWVEFGGETGEGTRLVHLHADDEGEIETHIERVGKIPLPPYIGEGISDPERYQTVYAQQRGSAAAPTAGLHFTTELFATFAENDICVEDVSLEVGLGTFRPIMTETVEAHTMHRERYHIDSAVWARLLQAQKQQRRIVAIGTTTLRTLEAAAATGKTSGETDIYI